MLGGKADVPLKVANSVKCRHILVDKLSLAEQAIARLKAGEAFNKVAMDMVRCVFQSALMLQSTDKAKDGGNLGASLAMHTAL